MTTIQPYYRGQQILFLYGIYRLILATALTAAAFLPAGIETLLPNINTDSFQLATLAYLVLVILGMLITVNERLSHTPIVVLLITDILLLMLIMRYSGGVESGLGSLLLITVGLGGLLLPLKYSLLIAAVATSSLIYTELLPFHVTSEKALLQAALLGTGYFAETLFLQYVTHRMKNTEQLARAQADTILDLRHLNELIVQRMRTGIIVITVDGAIRLLNDSARELLGIKELRPFWLPKPLQERLVLWQTGAAKAVDNYQPDADHPVVQISFAKLQVLEDSDIIVFLEDVSRVQQQAQQLKLASLGRLTASIAHEVRNPLGAISHAAQLLEEIPDLTEGDKRLLDIIHTHSLRVNNIIETILELSRKRPKMLEKVSLRALIEQCLRERITQQTDHPEIIDCEWVEDIWLEVDVNQLKQVFHNLFDNGLRYSELHTQARTLHLKTGQLQDTQQMYLDIEDNGTGVPEEQIKHLFEPFFTTESKGTGLGLYIAKELCEANRLTLTYVADRPGGCFRMTFAHTVSQFKTTTH